MPTVQELAVILTREEAAGFARNALAMPAEKLTWKPMDAGRSALDMIIECGAMNLFTPKILEARAFPDIQRGWMDSYRAENDTLDKALDLLQSGTDALVAAIQAFPAEDLDETITLPFGGGMTKSYAEVMLVPYWNMCYHQGQICYIQTLYGDREMH
ncbi:MAG: hypothetical protein KY468_20965 [Armatimonadetes bacterium]|nr:hypothetical protein [Armatimonadota bacterium]